MANEDLGGPGRKKPCWRAVAGAQADLTPPLTRELTVYLAVRTCQRTENRKLQKSVRGEWWPGGRLQKG